MKTSKIIQIVIGILLIIAGFGMVFQSMELKSQFVGGILLGEGGVLILWGCRELFGGLVLK